MSRTGEATEADLSPASSWRDIKDSEIRCVLARERKE